MTLKEKFKKQLDTATPTLNRPFYQAKECEKIADEFAIEFAEWFVLRYTEAVFYRENYIADLLKEFKKEKGL